MLTAFWIAVVIMVGFIAVMLIDIRNQQETMRLYDEARDFDLRLMGFDWLHDGEN